ncbi:MAG: oligosaccharide flippase family protein [Thaumarchaeota archaeon]|nr:oligosaccharide flippase family protein [Nitrososphaerota archaeon]
MASESSSLWEVGAEAVREGYGFFLGNTISTAILAIGSIVIARLLGSEAYGLYSLSFVFPSILVLFTSLGIDQSIIKYLSEYASKRMYMRIRELFQVSLLFKLGLGLAATTLLYYSSDMLASLILQRPYIGALLKLSSLLVLFQTLYTLSSSLFIGLGRASLAGAIATLQAVVKVSAIILLLILGLGLWGAVFGHVFGYVIAAIAGLVAGFLLTRIRSDDDFDGSASSKAALIKPLIVYGLPLYASTILTVISSQYVNIVLANFASNVEIGSYAVAMNLSSIIMLVIMPIATVLYPSFSRVEVIEESSLPRAFELAVRYSILLVAPTSLFVSAFSKELVDVIYGEGFELASSYLSLYALLYLAYPLLSVAVSYFNGTGLPKKTFLANLLIFSFILAASPMLAVAFKVMGVVAAVVLANLVGILYATFFVVRKQGITLRGRQLVRIYLSALSSILLTILIIRELHLGGILALLLGGIIFLFLYLTLTAALNALDEIDYLNLRRMLGGLALVGRLAILALNYMEFLNKHVKLFRR